MRKMYMRKLFTLLSGIFMLNLSLSAQKITGVVKDDQGKGLAKTTVTLIKSADSAVAKYSATDNDGKFTLDAAPGRYLITITHVGYAPFYTNSFEVAGSGDVAVGDLILSKAETSLEGIVVSSKKPLVEVKADKMVLNVEGTINSVGNDGLELLRKSPGVTIDKDDNISLSGKNGVRIYIDGKPSPLSGADLAAFLKSLQSSQIEAIEIITNPSAKYDAAGNAGIINIRLKKNKTFGTNGSVNAGYAVGKYSKYNGGLTFNHRDKGINVFGSYNYNRNKSFNELNLHRDLLDTIFNQRNTIVGLTHNHGFKGGVDLFVNSKSTIGVLVNGTVSNSEAKTDSKTPISYKQTGVVDRILTANNQSKSDRTNLNFNINYRYADTAGRELNVDADYGLFRINSDQYQPNIYYHPVTEAELSRAIYSFVSPTDIDIYTIKADYEQNYKGGKLGLGFKSAFTTTSNHFERYNVNLNSKDLDIGKSNHFDYRENINAVYANYNRAFLKQGVTVQAGLRLEHTSNNGTSYALNSNGTINESSKNEALNRSYLNLFPSAAITFAKNPMKQWTVSYSRRIDRPAYQDLNPFEFKLDEYTYQKGNTNLRPQFTNNISITNVYKYRLTSTLTYSHVADVFTQLVDTADKSKAFQTKENLATQNIVSLNVSYPFMYKTYTMFANLNSFYSRYEADFGGGDRKVNLDVFSYNLYVQNSLRFGKKKQWTGELSGYYTSPSIYQGTFKVDALWMLDAGLQRTILKGNGNFKVAVTDIFQGLQYTAKSNFSGQSIRASGRYESRQFKVNFTWRFGSNQVKAARQRKTGSEEEIKRTESSSGMGIGGN
jgi:iron complex outermembrane receptor protein